MADIVQLIANEADPDEEHEIIRSVTNRTIKLFEIEGMVAADSKKEFSHPLSWQFASFFYTVELAEDPNKIVKWLRPEMWTPRKSQTLILNRLPDTPQVKEIRRVLKYEIYHALQTVEYHNYYYGSHLAKTRLPPTKEQWDKFLNQHGGVSVIANKWKDHCDDEEQQRQSILNTFIDLHNISASHDDMKFMQTQMRRNPEPAAAYAELRKDYERRLEQLRKDAFDNIGKLTARGECVCERVADVPAAPRVYFSCEGRLYAFGDEDSYKMMNAL